MKGGIRAAVLPGVAAVGLGLALAACAAAPPPACGLAPGARAVDETTVAGPRSYLDGWPARAGDGWVHGVVEIPAGTLAKWEVDHHDGTLRWELRRGRPRVVRYLPYPASYGMIPSTLMDPATGGDGDPLDVVLLGAALPRGAVVRARVVGVLRLRDGGEVDDKLLAVTHGSPFERVADLPGLESDFPGVTRILETWFTHYKGPGRVVSLGFAGRAAAEQILEEAIAAFARDRTAARRGAVSPP